MKKILLTLVLALIGIHTTTAQVGIGTETPKTSLQVVGKPASTTTADGVQVPSLSLAQLDAKVAAYGTNQNGAIVYIDDVTNISSTTETASIDAVGFYYYDAGSDTWKALGINLTSDNNSILLGGGGTKLVSDFWLNAGNSGSNPATDFLGTTDNQGLSIRTNSLERMRVDDTGNVGIGTSTPANTLDVNGGTIIRGRLNMEDKGGSPGDLYTPLYNNIGFTILRAAASRNEIVLWNADLTYAFAAFERNNTVFNSDKLTLNGNVEISGNTTAAGTVKAKRYELTAPSGISAAATTELDLSTGNVLTLNLSTNITTLTLTNTAVGTYLIKFVQDGTGSRTVAFPNNWLWSGGTVPTVTPTANKTDIVTLIYDGTTYYAAISQNF